MESLGRRPSAAVGSPQEATHLFPLRRRVSPLLVRGHYRPGEIRQPVRPVTQGSSCSIAGLCARHLATLSIACGDGDRMREARDLCYRMMTQHYRVITAQVGEQRERLGGTDIGVASTRLWRVVPAAPLGWRVCVCLQPRSRPQNKCSIPLSNSCSRWGRDTGLIRE